MSAPITLRCRAPLPEGTDVSALRPGMTRAELERALIVVEGCPYPAADLFELRGIDGSHLVFDGDCRALRRLGAGMATGNLTVHGDAGDEVGLDMSGGAIHVQGNAGRLAGAQMRGGLIDIAGDCGDCAGGALAGARQGMRGGLLHVHGNAGDRTGEGMRRGVLLVDGDTGDFAGARMLAGTLILGGSVGAHAGFGLKRGTLLLCHHRARMPGYFNDCGAHEFAFLTLLSRALADRLDLPAAPLWRRWCGDLAEGGHGEILVPAGTCIAMGD